MKQIIYAQFIRETCISLFEKCLVEQSRLLAEGFIPRSLWRNLGPGLALGFIPVILLFFLQACGQSSADQSLAQHYASEDKGIDIIDPKGTSLETRILPPEGYHRIELPNGSFAEYLRQLPLKPHNSEVKLYNGSTKPNYNVYDAVVDLRIGNRDLHQCADAVMRLRAEYLYQQKQYEKIHFNFTNGFNAEYKQWMKGKRIVVKGNRVYWTEGGKESNTYNDFWKYMEMVFSYAGTLSLSKELKEVRVGDVQIGDVFIQGGSPGHAIIVVDMAVDQRTSKKIFLLAQSYMPAQEIQILKNPNDKELSPWYSVDFGEVLESPEWTFSDKDLKRFKE